MYECDFIPAEYREQRRVRTMARRRAFCIAALIGIMLIWFASNESRLSSVQAMMDDISDQKNQIDVLAARKAEMEQGRAALNNLQVLLRELSGRRSLVLVFAELSRRIPEEVVLTGCTISEPTFRDYAVNAGDSTAVNVGDPRSAVRPAARADDPLESDLENSYHGLTLVGVARSNADIIDFAAALDKSQLFYQVNMDVKDAVMFAGLPARKFELTCRIARQSEAGK